MKVKVTDLVELRDIGTGYQFRGRVEHDPQGNVAVLQVRDLKDGDGDLPGDLITVRIDKSVEPYRVRRGDVIFLSRGHRLTATAIRNVGGVVIVPSYFFILRPTPNVLPEYLAWFINSSKAQAQLKPVHTGTHMPLVSKSDFEQLEVDVPPLDVQRAIVEIDALARREQQLQAQLLEARKLLIDNICSRAASGRGKKGK